MTPFEVAFFEPQFFSGPVNFTLNRIVDTIFVVDIFISMFLPYRASQRAGGMMVYDNKKSACSSRPHVPRLPHAPYMRPCLSHTRIPLPSHVHLASTPPPSVIQNYLRGWFALDVFTCIPFDLLFYAVAEAYGLQVDVNQLRLLRMFRILKLMRIVRASRIISRWQDHVAISFAVLSLLKFSLLTTILAHWLACLWGFIGMPWSTSSFTWIRMEFSSG